MALIELSPEETTAQPGPGGLPPAYVYRRLGLLLGALLVLVLGGAAPPQSLLWRHVAFLPLRDADFTAGDGQVYALDFTTDPPTIKAWSGRTGRELWEISGPAAADGPYAINARIPGLVLVNVRRSTTVLDSRTGTALWNSTTQLTPLGTGTGLITTERFRPGTEYDQESGDPGILYGTSSDVLHTEPALSTTLRGVDLRTGRELWTTTVPGSISTSWSGTALVVFSSDRIAVRSPSTGAVLRERRLDSDTAGQVWAETVGPVVLLHHGAYGEDEQIVAYSLDTLDEIWQQEQPDSEGSSFGCTGMPCLRSRDDLAVLDPGSGAVRWRTDGTVDLEAFGDAVLQVQAAGDPRAVVDRRTGRTLVDLERWTISTPLPDDRGLLLMRAEAGAGLVLGVLPTGGTQVQLLGRVPGGTVPCRADTDVVVCQGDSGVDLFRYLS
ncbi:PQQ-binding-like beta-propeller repeat protein [Actinoplanes sp. NPDC051494]|uniref:outer membrane protein assembly factor BamB family protein n=1 Tax=Actinoplanes sp. NPDC051494 TaxID=3363907 RepID=UPI00379B9A7E